MARAGSDRFNEGYALGTMATVAALRGNLREAEDLGNQALALMRAIEQLWGAARACSDSATWPGCEPSTTPPGALPGSAGHPARRQRTAGHRPLPGRASAASRSSRVTWPPPGSTWPRACG